MTQFTKANIPQVKSLLNKIDKAATVHLDAAKRGAVLDPASAEHTAIQILGLGLGFDAESVLLTLGHTGADLAAITECGQSVLNAKSEAEKLKKVQLIMQQKMKEDKQREKEEKQNRKNQEKQRRLEDRKKQTEDRKSRRVLTVSGFDVDDITVIIPAVTDWLSKNESVYLTGGLLARWSDSNESMVVLDKDNFGSLLGMGFAFRNYGGKQQLETNEGKEEVEIETFYPLCPDNIMRAILGTAYFHGIRPVDALLRHPVVTPEGEVRGSSKGYDNDYRLLFADDTALEEVDLDTAYKDLFDVFHEFPQTAVPGAMATIFTLLTRVFLPTAPMICMDAPTVSSGKSLLARCCTKIVCGENVRSRSQEATDEEFDKNLKSFIQSNPGQVLFLDDFEGFIKYNVLKTLLTEPDAYSFRILGTPKSCVAKTNFTIILTGNQIQLSLDITRRSILVNIDTGEENPSHRKLSRTSDELMSYCVSERDHLLSCAIAILKDSLINATEVHNTRVMGSFERWSSVVGKSVMYVTEQLKARGYLKENINGDVTPDMRKWSQTSGGAAEVFHEIYEYMKVKAKRGDASWKIQDLDTDTLRALDSLLGIQKDNATDTTRGSRLVKQKDIPRAYVEYREDTGEPDEQSERKYTLNKLTNRKWRIVEANGKDLYPLSGYAHDAF